MRDGHQLRRALAARYADASAAYGPLKSLTRGRAWHAGPRVPQVAVTRDAQLQDCLALAASSRNVRDCRHLRRALVAHYAVASATSGTISLPPFGGNEMVGGEGFEPPTLSV